MAIAEEKIEWKVRQNGGRWAQWRGMTILLCAEVRGQRWYEIDNIGFGRGGAYTLASGSLPVRGEDPVPAMLRYLEAVASALDAMWKPVEAKPLVLTLDEAEALRRVATSLHLNGTASNLHGLTRKAWVAVAGKIEAHAAALSVVAGRKRRK